MSDVSTGAMNPPGAVRVHPGRILAREMEARGMTVTRLAYLMGKSERALVDLLNGKRSIDGYWARALAGVLGTSEALWLNLQRQYDAPAPAVRDEDEV
jgi:addiction module HigA family antidote